MLEANKLAFKRNRMIKHEIENRLAESAMGYFEIGISNFHKVRNVNWYSFQPALGNLCVSIELMLKSLIAKKCFRFLFSNLPLELEIKLIYNEKKAYKISKVEELGLLNFSYNTQEIDKCISIFYILFPEKKQEYKPFFKLFSSIRNVSVHGAFPKFQKYDLERIAFLSLNLYKILKNEELHKFHNHKLTKQEENFLNVYDHLRNERVKKIIEEAKSKSEKIEQLSSISLDDWDFYVINVSSM